MIDLLTLEYETREIALALAWHRAHIPCETCQAGQACAYVQLLEAAAQANRELIAYLRRDETA